LQLARRPTASKTRTQPHRSDRSTLRVVAVIIITLVAGVKCRFLGVAACLEHQEGLLFVRPKKLS